MSPSGIAFAPFLLNGRPIRVPEKGKVMELLTTAMPLAAAGPAFLVWLFGGGFGLALVVFVVLKLMGK
jgi:hypothetical protein